MHRFWLLVGLAFLIIGLGVIYKTSYERRIENLPEKLYVAAEADGFVSVLDPNSQKMVRAIDLTEDQGGTMVRYHPHNVQVAPDGQSVWVAANAEKTVRVSENILARLYAQVAQLVRGPKQPLDEVIVIDPESDMIIDRIPLGENLGLAHVVLSPHGFAWVSAEKTNLIYKIDARSYKVVQKIATPARSGPHGMRLSPDGSKIYVAMVAGKSLGIFDTATAQSMRSSLGGLSIQTAVTPDGRYALATVFDLKDVVVFNIATQDLVHIHLPAGAAGPVELYPSPDSNSVYVADGGYVFNTPPGGNLYKIDLKELKVVGAAKTGRAPHGVVLNHTGNKVFVSNFLDDNVAIVDAITDQVLARIYAGRHPVGVSFWSRKEGGMP